MKPIPLGAGSIGIASCWHLFKRPGGIEVCVYGSASYTGCSGGCGYASVPNPGQLMIAGRYTVSGTLVNVETGRAIAAMPVSLIMPTRTRSSTRTDAKGKFKIVVNPDPRSDRLGRFKESLDFGRMETAPEAKQITLVGDLTKAFRRAHPELEWVELKVSKFAGKTVHASARRHTG